MDSEEPAIPLEPPASSAPPPPQEAKPEPKKRKRDDDPSYDKQRRVKVQAAGGRAVYREQQKEAKEKAPEATQAKLQKQREYKKQRDVKVQAAGGEDAYREQQQKAQSLKRLYREQQKARTHKKAMTRKRKRRFRDDGLPEAQRMATQVQNELRKAGMFGRCLASLKKAQRGKLWRYFLQLLKKRSFHVDIEGRRKAPPWEIAIVTEEAR